MSAPEQWPTEAAATAAVDAVAKKMYEQQAESAGYDLPSWEDADPMVQLRAREAVLPLVWQVIAALPDPRYVAWEEGNAAGDVDNPYPVPQS